MLSLCPPFRAVVSLCFAGLASVSLMSRPVKAQAPVDLPLFHREGHTIIPNRVELAVAGGPVARVTFDTGSTGLRILESFVGPDVRRTDEPMREVYGDGTEFEGYLGYGVVAFRTRDGALLRTAAEVPIHVVTKVTCVESKPRCPGQQLGDAGVMGLRFDQKRAGMLSPLRFLPGALANGFIVDVTGEEPHVRLGLNEENTRGFRFARLSPANPATTSDGKLSLWVADSITSCFSIEGSESVCGPVLFDTGGSAMDINMDGLPPELLAREFLRAGVRLAFEVPDVFRLTFRSEGHHDVRIRPGHGSNSGERFFRHYLVAFDGQNGRIGFLARGHEEDNALQPR
ncbi:hypothetical protein V5F29_04295 [Xanthobacter aminoxidans]|uniref:hypothetical protein n=1 Tax=Xanthobacter aminoxidans TaxID=186280 RepID=UPI003726ABEC